MGEFQITSSFEGLVETVPGMNLNLLKMDTYKMDMSKDTLFRGEFPVVQKLVEKLADGAAAEREHRRVKAELRDHGRRRPGLLEVQDHGQHPQVLLLDPLHRLHQAGW